MKKSTHYNRASKQSKYEPQDENLNLLTDSIKIIESIYQMRFIEKIARPVEKRIKEELVEKVAGKMQSLHTKLEKIKIGVLDKTKSNENGDNKNKSIAASLTLKPIDWRKSIRNIENRYTEVFIEGSFKHYHKLYNLNIFSYPLKIIHIEQWSRLCLNKNDSSDTCC